MRLRQFAVGSIVLLYAAAAFAQGAPAPAPAPAPVAPPPPVYPPQAYPPQQYPPQQYPPQQYPPQQYPPQAAAPPLAPAPAKADTEEAEPENEYGFHKRSSISLGGAFFGDSLGTQRFGATLEYNKVYPVAGRWGIGLRIGWGLTEWDRFDKWTSAGRSIGGWTTTAYSDVYHWSIKKDEYTLFRVIGSIYAYIVLVFPLIAAGVCYVGAVFSPTTFLEAAVTANYDFGGPELGPFIELGLGAAAFIHPKYDNLRGGIGPTFGGGVHVGHLRVGAHMTWSPHLLHGEPSGGRSDVYIGGLTIGLTGT